MVTGYSNVKTISGASVQQRIAEGRARRNVRSRRAHASVLPEKRDFDPIAVLLAAGANRVQQLLPIKYGRMKASPFAFFRGAVSIMAADLGRLPNSGILAQLCGDAHVQNLGSFAAPDGRIIFDLNDFDETARGPWEWDVKRMAASLVLAGRECGHDGIACQSAAEICAASYCRYIREFSVLPVLQVARHQVHREERIAPIHAALLQSERARPGDLLRKLTTPDASGTPRFRDERPLSWRVIGNARKQVLDSLASYRESLAPERRHLFNMLRCIDVGFKVVGTGSVGLRDYVVLFEGNGPGDTLFLQVKEEVASAYVRYLSDTSKKTAGGKRPASQHEGRRAAEGQRALQPMSDLLLGWTRIGSGDYLVRQLNDHKGGIDLRTLRGGGLRSLALVAGELLARGHARSGDACQIRGYCGSGEKMARALGSFAAAYADQTEADYRAFVAAIAAGKIKSA